MPRFAIAAVINIALNATPALAQSFETTAVIDAQIAAAAGAPVGSPGGAATRVDARLKLARCPEPLTIDPSTQGAFAVRCAALGWRIRVPAVAASTANAQTITIERGDAVDVVAGGTGFEVSTSAVAIESGAIGKSIRIKAIGATSAITATVIAPGKVSVSN